MIRKTLRPRLWWVLLLPFAFYFTRTAYVERPSIIVGDTISTAGSYDVATAESASKKYDNAVLKSYWVLGQSMDINTYQVIHFIANACLVIGCLSVGKELFLNNTTAPTAPRA